MKTVRAVPGGSFCRGRLPFDGLWWRRQTKRGRQRQFRNSYAGTQVTHNAYRGSIPVIDSGLSPRDFFERYVSRRSPVLIRAPLSELARLDEGWWRHPSAAAANVHVETRADDSEPFGQGRRVTMQYGELLRAFSEGSTRHYLTTQETSEDMGTSDRAGAKPSGAPHPLFAPPLDTMAAEGLPLPLRPSVLSALVPQSINLWLGQTRAGEHVSSGLHHDYHDNLYVLLNGQKRFRLFSPKGAAKKTENEP